jgi:endonuclease/exonuclease/phosphatase family metal-dependent hydrolase
MKDLPRTAAAGMVLALALSGCIIDPGSGKQEALKTITIATWNTQTLFDGHDCGIEYDEYREYSGWSEEKYRARLQSIAEAVNRMGGKTPDILALQEIENKNILTELAEGALAEAGYGWTFFASNPRSSLGLGILSRLPLIEVKAHSINNSGKTAPRPVLEARIEYGGQPLVLFVCHWKSKIGGDRETEPQRRASARVVHRRLRELGRENPSLPAIVLGDLNENYDEFYRQTGTTMSALLPDDLLAMELSGCQSGNECTDIHDFLVVSRRKPPQAQYFPPGTPALYSPWGEEMQKGSYYYQGAWETIDHFLLNGGLFDGTGWEFGGCEALDREPFVNGSGYPNIYNPRTGMGQSDHLPLLLTLLVPTAEKK